MAEVVNKIKRSCLTCAACACACANEKKRVNSCPGTSLFVRARVHKGDEKKTS